MCLLVPLNNDGFVTIHSRVGPISKACISAKWDGHLPFRRGSERNPAKKP
jgi:hypothetical protein